MLERGLDTRTPRQLALIAGTADAIKLLFGMRCTFASEPSTFRLPRPRSCAVNRRPP